MRCVLWDLAWTGVVGGALLRETCIFVKRTPCHPTSLSILKCAPHSQHTVLPTPARSRVKSRPSLPNPFAASLLLTLSLTALEPLHPPHPTHISHSSLRRATSARIRSRLIHLGARVHIRRRRHEQRRRASPSSPPSAAAPAGDAGVKKVGFGLAGREAGGGISSLSAFPPAAASSPPPVLKVST